MLRQRTDLALEARELWRQSAGETTRLEGVEAGERRREGWTVTAIRITGPAGVEALGKPEGNYITLELAGLEHREEGAFGRAVRALAEELRALLPSSGGVLVAGLGNRAITPDAIGPQAYDHTLITRHLVDQMPEHFGHLRPVAGLAAGVLGTTGVESGQMIQAVARQIQAGCIIAVDALASRSLSRVCSTIQLADTGITPGSGVGNHRHALNRETMGIPVIALGVPTVVDGATLAADILAEAGRGELEPEALAGTGASLMVTPRDIDSRVADLSKVIGYGISLAINPQLTLEDMELMLS